MPNIYRTRASVDIAYNDKLGVRCYLLYYRNDATEYCVMSDTSDFPTVRFTTKSEAIQRFDELTAGDE